MPKTCHTLASQTQKIERSFNSSAHIRHVKLFYSVSTIAISDCSSKEVIWLAKSSPTSQQLAEFTRLFQPMNDMKINKKAS